MSVEVATGTDGRIVCPFDHHSSTYGQEFREVLDGLRDASPIVWSESYGGFWVVTSYDAVRKMAIDADTFTVAPGPDRTGGLRIPPPPGLKTRPLFVPGETDGAEHDGYRLALNPHFSKARVAQLQPMIEAHINAVVDSVLEVETIDCVDDLIAPILAGIACEHLGLEVDDPVEVFRSLHRMVSMTPSDSETFEQIRASFESSWGRLVEVVRARRAEPRDDVISNLVKHESPSFTDEQVEMMTMNVILGASHTTSSLLAQILIHLDEDPALRERLRAAQELLPKAVEEFLRLKAVSISIGRTATRDVEIEGAHIKRGDRVLLAFAAANYDPARYPHPAEFDLERGAAQHLGMGVGSHFCLGAWLAKSIVVNTLRVLFDRLDHLAIDHEHVVVSPEVSNAYALEHVPARVIR